MADAFVLTRRLQRAEERLQRAVGLAQIITTDKSKEGLFKATVRDLVTLRKGFEDDHLAFEIAAKNDEHFDVAAHAARFTRFEDNFFEVMAALEALKEPQGAVKRMNTAIKSDDDASGPRVPLPRLTLPVFNGEVRLWTSFANLFRSLIATHPALSKVERLAYLRTSVVGEPLTLIQSLPLTDENYEVAWEVLTRRYENKRLVTSQHLDALISVPLVSQDSPVAFRQLLTAITENVAALRGMDVPVDTWDLLLIHILEKKLDASLRQQWELTLSADSVPKLHQFVSFLERQCQSMEAVARYKVRYPTTKAPTSVSKLYSSRKHDVPNHPSSSFINTKSMDIEKCVLCTALHPLFKCPEFLEKSPAERHSSVKQSKSCFNCLRSKHVATSCPSSHRCRHCSGKHHSLLHFQTSVENTDRPAELDEDSQADVSPGESTSSSGTFTGITSQTTALSKAVLPSVLLSTAVVDIITPQGIVHSVRVLLDSASEACFITEACVQRLGLVCRQTNLPVHGLAHTPVAAAKSVVSCTIRPVGQEQPYYPTEAFVLSKISPDLPALSMDPSSWSHVSQLPLADPNFAEPGPIDMLLGAEVFAQVFTGRRCEGGTGQPVALDTVFGWVLMGKVNMNIGVGKTNAFFISSVQPGHPQLGDIVKRFWELEEVPGHVHTSPSDVACESLFMATHKRDATGRYVVSLPFVRDEPNLGNSRSYAVRCLESLERRLKRDELLHNDYTAFMQDYLDTGHMELIDGHNQDHCGTYYIPHHGVCKPTSTTTKLRVVFNASAKASNGLSLNDVLSSTPKLQADISDLLLRFRCHAIVFTGDIKQMYRQIFVDKKHQDYQRIVWRWSPDEPVQDYRLKTVTYGVSASPFLAIRTIHQLADDMSAQYPTAARVLRTDVYVDDVVTGASTVAEAQSLRREVGQVLLEGGFTLRKFVSNHPAVLEGLKTEDLYGTGNFSFDQETRDVVNVLGLKWDPWKDSFSYDVHPISSKINKRSMLSNLARIFDPLGLLTPVTLVAKVLIQELWLRGMDWDDSPPSDIVQAWCKFQHELEELACISLPRFLGQHVNTTQEIHGFCDSSEKGYAAVVYLKVVHPDGHITVSLLVAKSKVAPIKKISIPRLELCAAVLLAKLLKYVCGIYQGIFPIHQVCAWTDSTVTLHWVTSSPHKWHTFVANRVCLVQDMIPGARWQHVRSEDNPADCASRGLFPAQLVHHPLWWNGPTWLISPLSNIDQAPMPDISGHEDSVNAERRTEVATFVANVSTPSFLVKFSSLTTLQHVLAYCLRFAYNCRAKGDKRSGPLTGMELREALRVCIKGVQQVFSEDKRRLDNQQQCSWELRSLNPFVDADGLIRVGGRLSHSKLPYQTQHPILLPKTHPVTYLIIEYYHVLHLHPGPRALQAILCQKFWIISARSVIRRVLRRCMSCFRANPSTISPPMGDLPAHRVQQIKPFDHTGVDYGGPFQVTMTRARGSKATKAYLCLFICMATKALHLELVSDLTTEAFMAALHRFVSRRGRPAHIYSDCGSNFIGAQRELKDVGQLLQSANFTTKVVNAISHEGISWHFNPPAAPHFGGLWEAGMRSVKTYLRHVVGQQILSFEEMTTVLVRIEATLNSRPLCAISPDPSELEVLTPAHFLILQPLSTFPEIDLTTVQLSRLSRWQLIQRIVQDFWKRWMKEYLHTLQQRSKWTRKADLPRVGDLVIIKEDNTPPLTWRLARIVLLHPGKDNIPRVATVRTSSGVVQRPLVKLCPLPTDPLDNIPQAGSLDS